MLKTMKNTVLKVLHTEIEISVILP